MPGREPVHALGKLKTQTSRPYTFFVFFAGFVVK